ncbi:MAG TPA: hypothetical protein VGO58_04870 [Chitinophagaceae bacterium]|jgi:hypothetical protein|nr:hypothetical protein [Chitinophagaceae bacterium]
MKKIFTLLFAVGMVAAVQAQPGSRDNRDTRPATDQRNDDRRFDNDHNADIKMNPYDRDLGYNDNGKFANERRLKMEIARINRDYDLRIQKVKNNFFMSRFEKQRQVRLLEQKRQQEIRMATMTSKKGNQNNGRGFPDNRRY